MAAIRSDPSALSDSLVKKHRENENYLIRTLLYSKKRQYKAAEALAKGVKELLALSYSIWSEFH